MFIRRQMRPDLGGTSDARVVAARVTVGRVVVTLLATVAVAGLLAGCGPGRLGAGAAGTGTAEGGAAGGGAGGTDAAGTVWLCWPGMTDDPCTQSLATTVVSAAGATSVVAPKPATASPFNCFYVYGTVSEEPSVNADLKRGRAEIAAAQAVAQFAPLCAMYAPVYRQVTEAGLAAHPDLDLGSAETVTAYDSIRSGFEDFLAHYDDGRPFIVIGDSQGAAMLNLLLARLVDDRPALRASLVAAIILGGNVEVPPGKLTGGTFKHIPLCHAAGQAGCVIAYSSFPSVPPADALFGRAGQGVSLQSAQPQKADREVACVNPAALSGGRATLDSVFPAEGGVTTPWVAYPGRYVAQCETSDGATWLEVTAPAADHRPDLISEALGPQWGYHLFDLPLGQGDLTADVAAAERTWSASSHQQAG
ncbi:MAG TPA: DUF3089 domain-containing protein [Trebonia sp.]|nr:DUF3089 domain-containing protein [Trebonia sp.]